jgi:hypothetical protein
MRTFYTRILYHNYTSLAPQNLVGDSSSLFTCIFSCTQFTSPNYASLLFGVNTSQKHACWHVIMWYNYVPCIWDAFTRKKNVVQLWYVQIYLCYVYYSKAILTMQCYKYNMGVILLISSRVQSTVGYYYD